MKQLHRLAAGAARAGWRLLREAPQALGRPGFLALVLALVLALGLCVPRPALAQTEVSFWHAMRGQRGEVLERLIQDFNQANSDVRVVGVFQGSEAAQGNDYAALNRALLESLARGNPPALAQVYENWTPQLIEVKALTPVDNFFEGPGGLTPSELQDFVQVFREANRFGQPARTWTLPFNKSVFVLYYNRKIFSELGLKPPRTYDELASVAGEIARRKHLPGLACEPTVDLFGHYLVAYGGAFIVDDQVGFGGPLGERGMAYWTGLAQRKAAEFSPQAADRFAAGQAGMYIETTSKLGRLSKALPDLGVAPLPRGGGQPAVQAAGTNLAIFAGVSPEGQKAAWKFVRYLTSPEVTQRWARETGYLPVRLSAIRSPEYQAFLKQNPDYSVGLSELGHVVVEPRTPAWESIRGVVDDALIMAVSGRMPPQEAVQRAVVLSNEILVRMR